MKLFNIDYTALVRLLLPVRLRLAIMLSWLAALIYPIALLHVAFRVSRDKNLYRLKHTGQVVYLEAVLNDRFDLIDRRIYIEDAPYAPRIYLYQDEEVKPQHLYLDSEETPLYLYRDSETVPGGFIVFVPAAVAFNEAAMRALINRYKLPGRTYSIQIM